MGRLIQQQIWKPPKLGEWLEGVKDEVAWLIPGLVPKAGLALISGQQKLAFKTFLSDALSLLVSSGESCGLLTPTVTGPVLYVEEEGQEAQTRDRLYAVARGLGVNAKKAEVYYAFRQRVKLDSELWVKRLTELTKAIEPTLVILDALVYLHGADENKTHEMKPVVELIQDLRERGCAVLCLAHLNSMGGDESKDIDEQVRGSKIIVNAYDSHLALRRKTRQEKYIKLIARHRGAPEREYKIYWDLKSYDDDPDRLYRAVPMMSRVDDDVEMMARLEEMLRLMDPRIGYSLKQVSQLWGLNQQITKRFLNLGIDTGRVLIKNKKEYYVIPKGVEA